MGSLMKSYLKCQYLSCHEKKKLCFTFVCFYFLAFPSTSIFGIKLICRISVIFYLQNHASVFEIEEVISFQSRPFFRKNINKNCLASSNTELLFWRYNDIGLLNNCKEKFYKVDLRCSATFNRIIWKNQNNRKNNKNKISYLTTLRWPRSKKCSLHFFKFFSFF